MISQRCHGTNTSQYTSWIILMCYALLYLAAATEIHFKCDDQPAGESVSEKVVRIKENIQIEDGNRTCTFKVDMIEYQSHMRLQVDIPPEKSPDCDAEQLLLVGEDENSLQKVCGNETYLKRFSKTFTLRYRQREHLPQTDGVRVYVLQIVNEERLRCNMTIWDELETQEITIAETFHPGQIELPYHCWWRFQYPPQKNMYNHLIVNVNTVELEPSTSSGSSSNCGNNSLILRDGWEATHEKVWETCNNHSYNYFTKAKYAFVQVDIVEPSDLPFVFNFSVIAFSSVECYGQVITLKATNDVQLLESPGYPRLVPEDMKCRWQIESSDGNEVEVQFVDVNIDDHCGAGDNLEVWDGRQQLEHMCYRPRNKVLKYRSSNTSLLVYLETDNTNYGRGFTMKYYTKKYPSLDLPTDRECRPHMVTLKANSTDRYIQSPNYPGSYPDDQSCTWMIESDDDNNVEVEIVDMNITPGIDCTFDSLSIYDGTDINNTPLAKLCGKMDTLKGWKFRSSGHGLKLRFTTRDPGGRTGFKVKYYTKSEPSADLTNVTSCRGKAMMQLTANQSPKYIETEDYPNSTLIKNEDCRWLIHAAGERIEVNILGFELGTNNIINRLTIIQGTIYDNRESKYHDDTNQIVSYAGQKFESKGEYLVVRYNTDRIENDVLPNQGGFRLSYSIASNVNPTVDPKTTTDNTGKGSKGPGGAGTIVLNTSMILTTALVTTILMVVEWK